MPPRPARRSTLHRPGTGTCRGRGSTPRRCPTALPSSRGRPPPHSARMRRRDRETRRHRTRSRCFRPARAASPARARPLRARQALRASPRPGPRPGRRRGCTPRWSCSPGRGPRPRLETARRHDAARRTSPHRDRRRPRRRTDPGTARPGGAPAHRARCPGPSPRPGACSRTGSSRRRPEAGPRSNPCRATRRTCRRRPMRHVHRRRSPPAPTRWQPAPAVSRPGRSSRSGFDQPASRNPRSWPGAVRPTPHPPHRKPRARQIASTTARRAESSRRRPTAGADRHRFKHLDGSYPAWVDSARAYSLAASSGSRSTPTPCSYIIPSAIIAPARPCAAARRNHAAASSTSFATHSP